MPQFTFQGPDGQRHTIEGPEGSTPEQAFKILQGHLGAGKVQSPGVLKSAASGLIEGAGAPGDFSKSILGNAPPQQPIDQNTYYGKLIDALNMARKHLELPTSQDVGNAVGMQPTQPITGAEKAAQFAGRALPGMVMGGASAGGRAAMGAAPAANAVRGMGMSPQGPVSAIGGQASMQGAGDALQTQLLQAAAKHGAGAIGHAIGGPLGGLAAHYVPKVLGLIK